MATRSPWLQRARGLLPARWLRDARMVLDGLAGHGPPPFWSKAAPGGGPGGRAAAALPGARPLRVVAVTRETPDAVSLTLVDPRGAAIVYRAGQFFTLVVRVNGEQLRRAYSASLPPAEATPAGSVRLTIKRIVDGRASHRLFDHAAVGDVLDVFGPSGSFVVEGAPTTLVLLAGGSGVTPLRAIAQDALTRRPDTRVVFIVGNRSVGDIIFRDELAALARRYPERLRLRLVLSDPPAGWDGGTGMLDESTTARELDGAPVEGAAEYFVCGPTPMMDAVRACLLSRGVGAESVREERFSSPVHSVADDDTGGDVTVTAVIGGRSYPLVNHAHETVLESALRQGVPAQFSCTMGGCGACRMKLVEGAMTMEEPNCLSAHERDEGYVLTCIGRATRATVLEADPS